jgi:type IV pilus assembly protein PilB
MVGEIRDLETAEIAIKAAMTGHLVLSTLHTNDCPSAIGRLVDIGIPPYLLSASLTMVLSQRLIRTLCSKCKMPVKYEKPNELVGMGFSKKEIPDLTVFAPKGCPACNNIGYKGRIGLFELMAVTDGIAKSIYAADPEDRLRQIARREGMITLREAGLEKIRQGVTAVDEVLKHTIATKEVLLSYLLNPELKHYEDKDVIIREGTHDKDFFSLVQGTLMVKKKGKIIAKIMEPGEFFGEMASITGKPRSASIISKGKSTIKRFPGDKLPEIIEQYPDISKELFGMMASRLGRINQQIVLLRKSFREPEGRPVIAVKDQRSRIDRRRINAPGYGVERRIGTDRRVSLAG